MIQRLSLELPYWNHAKPVRQCSTTGVGYRTAMVLTGSGQVTNSAMESHAADLCNKLAQLRASADTVSFRDQRLGSLPAEDHIRLSVQSSLLRIVWGDLSAPR